MAQAEWPLPGLDSVLPHRTVDGRKDAPGATGKPVTHEHHMIKDRCPIMTQTTTGESSSSSCQTYGADSAATNK
eukprot:39322-Eustigmatos_ZCMA.PRE.1